MKSFKQRLEGKELYLNEGYHRYPKYTKEDVLKAHEDYKKDLIKEINNAISKHWNRYSISGLQKAKELIR